MEEPKWVKYIFFPWVEPQKVIDKTPIILYFISCFHIACDQVLHRRVGSQALASLEVQPCDEAEAGGSKGRQGAMG